MKLKDKVVAITGGGNGIGLAIARRFCEEGAKAALLDINFAAAKTAAKQLCDEGWKVLAVACDVTSKQAMDESVKEVIKTYGQIDIWVNSAGVSKLQPFLDVSEETWDRVIGINLKGSFFGCQAAIREMLPRKSGVIINLSSESGKNGNSQFEAYCASKFGIIGLTQALAREFGRVGIRVNALCPGPVFTTLWDGQLTDYAKKKGIEPEAVRNHFANTIPLGRVAETIDIANAALFLASDEAAFITGEALNVSGGSTMH